MLSCVVLIARKKNLSSSPLLFKHIVKSPLEIRTMQLLHMEGNQFKFYLSNLKSSHHHLLHLDMQIINQNLSRMMWAMAPHLICRIVKCLKLLQQIKLLCRYAFISYGSLYFPLWSLWFGGSTTLIPWALVVVYCKLALRLK